ncbi:hypothetical protein ACOME3_006603 [Neoechinorhynchus agilis]
MFVVDDYVKEYANVGESGRQKECIDSDEEINRILVRMQLMESRKRGKRNRRKSRRCE